MTFNNYLLCFINVKKKAIIEGGQIYSFYISASNLSPGWFVIYIEINIL